MFSNILYSINYELHSTSSLEFYHWWKFIIITAILSLIFGYFIPYVKYVITLRRFSIRRALKDNKNKFRAESQEKNIIKRYFYALSKPLRWPICFFKSYLFHFRKLKIAICRKNRYHSYRKRSNKLIYSIQRFHPHIAFFLSVIFIISFIYSRVV